MNVSGNYRDWQMSKHERKQRPILIAEPPHMHPVGDGLNFQLDHDFAACLHGYYIIVPAGFKTDLASVPRFFWRIVPPHQYPEASILHDYMYSAEYFKREKCDKFFREILIHRNASRLRAYAMWLAVRLFGWAVWRKHDPKDVKHLREQSGLPESVFPL
jgi:hypothetical protein